MPESLKNKTIKGTAWSFADNFLSQGISFLIGLALARLLTPKEYGVIGIVMIFIALFNCIVDSGFSNALIRKKDVKHIDYNTVFLFNLVFSILLFSVLFVSAPAISHFFEMPELVPVTRVMGSIVIINAFTIIQKTILITKIDFKSQTKISVIASITSGLLGLTMAFFGCGVWSLVGQQISRQLLNSVLLWIYNSWRPTFEFSTKSFKELFDFGSKLLVSSLIDTLWKEIYQVVIAKCYTVVSLGQYARAKHFSDFFSSNLTSVIQRVSYPVLSSIQDDKLRLKESYRRVIKVSMLISFVCMLGLATVAKSLILVLIGEKWLMAVDFLQIICFSAMLYPLHAINLNMLKVQGRSDLFLKLEIVKKCIAVGPLLLGIFKGIDWMLWGSVITSFFSYYLNSYYSGKLLNYSIKSQIIDILPSFCIAAFMSIILYGLSFINISPFILFPIQVVVGVLVVLIMCELTKIDAYKEIKSIASTVIGKYRYGK